MATPDQTTGDTERWRTGVDASAYGVDTTQWYQARVQSCDRRVDAAKADGSYDRALRNAKKKTERIRKRQEAYARYSEGFRLPPWARKLRKRKAAERKQERRRRTGGQEAVTAVVGGDEGDIAPTAVRRKLGKSQKEERPEKLKVLRESSLSSPGSPVFANHNRTLQREAREAALGRILDAEFEPTESDRQAAANRPTRVRKQKPAVTAVAPKPKLKAREKVVTADRPAAKPLSAEARAHYKKAAEEWSNPKWVKRDGRWVDRTTGEMWKPATSLSSICLSDRTPPRKHRTAAQKEADRKRDNPPRGPPIVGYLEGWQGRIRSVKTMGYYELFEERSADSDDP